MSNEEVRPMARPKILISVNNLCFRMLRNDNLRIVLSMIKNIYYPAQLLLKVLYYCNFMFNKNKLKKSIKRADLKKPGRDGNVILAVNLELSLVEAN